MDVLPCKCKSLFPHRSAPAQDRRRTDDNAPHSDAMICSQQLRHYLKTLPQICAYQQSKSPV